MVRSVEPLHLNSKNQFNKKLWKIDREIRQLITKCQMPSDFIELEFKTNPSFFSALNFHGHSHDLTLIRPHKFDCLAGLGIRSIRKAYLNGKPEQIGYLHHLRLLPEIRNSLYLVRGYRVIRDFFQQNPAKVTLTSILADNKHAIKTLEKKQTNKFMPTYTRVSRYLTSLIPLRGPGKRWPFKYRSPEFSHLFKARLLEESDISNLIKLFQHAGKQNDGLPFFKTDDLKNSKGLLQGLKVRDFVGLFANNELIAAGAIWNQQPWKQIIVNKLHPLLKFITRLWNLGQNIWQKCPVPNAGEQVNSILLDPWVIKPGYEKKAMPELLYYLVKQAQRKNADFAAIGIAEKHPAFSQVNTVFSLPYWSIIYQVHWPDSEIYDFSQNIPYLANLGTL